MAEPASVPAAARVPTACVSRAERRVRSRRAPDGRAVVVLSSGAIEGDLDGPRVTRSLPLRPRRAAVAVVVLVEVRVAPFGAYVVHHDAEKGGPGVHQLVARAADRLG